MADAKYGLRTISRSLISRQVTVEVTTGVFATALFPIPQIVAPTTLQVNPGIDLLELPGINCRGEEIIELSIPKGRKPELQFEFSVGAPEMDSLIHGHLMTARTTFLGSVFFEAVAESTTVQPRIAGQAGFEVVAQTPDSTAEVYYVDPITHLARKVALVSATPTGDQIFIDASLAITLSPELAATGALIRGWVPCVFSKATVISAKSIGLVSVKAMGIDFNGKYAGFSARNCSVLPGGSFGSDPKKQVKLRILADANDGTGLGYQFYYTNQDLVC